MGSAGEGSLPSPGDLRTGFGFHGRGRQGAGGGEGRLERSLETLSLKNKEDFLKRKEKVNYDARGVLAAWAMLGAKCEEVKVIL